MYEKFSARHFRRFEHVELGGLQRVNLITGPNGSGKTSLLEALFINAAAFNPEIALRVNLFRGMEGVRVDLGPQADALMRSLFHDFDVEKKAQLVGREVDGTVVKVEIAVPSRKTVTAGLPSAATKALTNIGADLAVRVLEMKTVIGKSAPVVTTLTVSAAGVTTDRPRPVRRGAVFLQPRTEVATRELAGRFGRVVVAKHEEKVVSALKMIEPRLTSLATVVEAENTILYADVGRDELVPLWLLGGGINHLAHIVLAILEERGRIVLVDEIENGVYHDILPGMWRVIERAAREADCQVFATTHSRECVAAAHSIFSETFDYGLSVHRLEASNGVVKAVGYDRETLQASIDDDFEVR